MINKVKIFISILCLQCIWVQNAQADIEALQGPVIGPIYNSIKKANEVQDELNSAYQEIRSEVEGAYGPMKNAVSTVQENVSAAQDKINAAKNIANDPEGSLNTIKSTFPGAIASVDTNDSKALNQAVQENYFMQKPKSSTTTASSSESQSSTTEANSDNTDLVVIHQAQEEKMREIQRENFANLYSSAFVKRANLSQEEAEDKAKENTRDIIQSTQDKAKQMVKRFQSIMLMEAMLFEFSTTQQARQYSYAEEEEDE